MQSQYGTNSLYQLNIYCFLKIINFVDMEFYRQLSETKQKHKKNIGSNQNLGCMSIWAINQAGVMSGSKTWGQTLGPNNIE